MHKLLRNRTEAGALLADKLEGYLDAADTLVLALPRGGVPVAYEIATHLHLPLDVLIVRKLGYPFNEEYALGAITVVNMSFINSDISFLTEIEEKEFQTIIQREQQELIRRNILYRDQKPPLNVKDKHVILVDDGIATGASIQAAILALRHLKIASICLAIPVLPVEALSKLKPLVDDIIFLFTPDPFVSVGTWYADFAQTTDEEVILLLK